jgi:hypothetical protein
MFRSFLLAAGVAFMVAGTASAQTVSQAGNYSQFKDQFCAADHSGQHIFVLPMAVFSDEKSVACDNGESMLRTMEPADDPGHIVFNIDPPPDAEAAFDCDGKADEGMTTVAINCLPADEESAMHPKPQ